MVCHHLMTKSGLLEEKEVNEKRIVSTSSMKTPTIGRSYCMVTGSQSITGDTATCNCQHTCVSKRVGNQQKTCLKRTTKAYLRRGYSISWCIKRMLCSKYFMEIFSRRFKLQLAKKRVSGDVIKNYKRPMEML